MTTDLYTCADCGAQFVAGRDWTHCQACGYHGDHACSGVARRVRLERAQAFVGQGLKKGQGWARLVYDYREKA